ncbi:MAG: SO_0444 family Cu/Zn efflux transporter [Lentimonas sp.]
MVPFLTEFSTNTWQLIAEMAPYLLFGFAVAGFLHILVRPKKIEQLLGKSGIASTLKACLVGVPMPLCSCSVIPVATSLRKSGASRGATASFLSATPQTGVDSILATYALMGGTFTIVRVVVALISGIVSGVLVDLFAKEQPAEAKPAPTQAMTISNIATVSPETGAPKSCCAGQNNTPKQSIGTAIRYGFVTLPADLGLALLVGLALGGLITTVTPENLLGGTFSSGILAFLFATLISLPLYICATASIPLAYALIAAGLSPGAALILLIVGPATNTTTLAAVWDLLGRRVALIYIGSLIVVSWITGALFNSSISAGDINEAIHQHQSMELASWQHACGVALVLLLMVAITRNWTKSTSKAPSCCAG